MKKYKVFTSYKEFIKYWRSDAEKDKDPRLKGFTVDEKLEEWWKDYVKIRNQRN